MKKFIPLFVLLSLPVLACPKLKGTYSTCVNQAGQKNPGLKVEQVTSNGMTIYKFGVDSREYIADGKERLSQKDLWTLKYTEVCNGNTLVSKQITENGQARIIEEAEFTKEGKHLVLESKKIINGQETFVKIVCK